jgi:hypothetical protein
MTEPQKVILQRKKKQVKALWVYHKGLCAYHFFNGERKYSLCSENVRWRIYSILHLSEKIAPKRVVTGNVCTCRSTPQKLVSNPFRSSSLFLSERGCSPPRAFGGAEGNNYGESERESRRWMERERTRRRKLFSHYVAAALMDKVYQRTCLCN